MVGDAFEADEMFPSLFRRDDWHRSFEAELHAFGLAESGLSGSAEHEGATVRSLRARRGEFLQNVEDGVKQKRRQSLHFVEEKH